ncbi:WGR domain-containing protein [Donghicola sp. C2-DW-16]|uniref:WGR domain-containing protein n=2 Tax=Donghicola mangrovi TaxID=2729614 RepID=A0ABX2PHI5_9RHOB|nr:WGR domain-containing protein [Donghicola mangrovi]
MTHPMPAPLRLTRCNPQRNMARFYEVSVRPTLFGEVSLIRNWGRIGTGGRLRTETFATLEEALSALRDLEQRKRRKGYEGGAKPPR